MVKMRYYMRNRIPVGYVPYSYSFTSLEYLLCKWYAYPIFRTIEKLKMYRAYLYAYLNSKGIMNTPEGCIMQLSDLWRKSNE